jgi:V/A-type H+-transporting ATPase subunit C
MANSALFASGVLAVLENKLLPYEKIKAIAEVETLEDSVKILYETGFGLAKSAEELKDFERALGRETANSAALLKDLSADEKTTEALLLPLDYHNLKTLLKARATGTPIVKLGAQLYSGGLFDVNIMQIELLEGGGNLRSPMKAVIEKVNGEGSGATPKLIDTETDLALYRDIAAVIKRVRSKAVVWYYRSLFDFVNISTLIRNKHAGVKEYAAQFIEGGHLPVGLFTGAAGGTLEDFFRALAATEYRQAAETAANSLKAHGNLLEYERYYKNWLFAKIRERKERLGTVEPLVHYFFAKETEIDNVRLILTCKKIR